MKYKWLNNVKNDSLIIFFNGWGMDESVVKHLSFGNYDVLMFYDYNSLNTDIDFESLNNKYSKKYLIAWSMGVMTATLFDKIKYDNKIAINGTLKPIDDKYGIPLRIYDLTIRNFSPAGAKKFIKNMFNDKFNDLDIKRTFEEQNSELSALKNYKSNPNFTYGKIWISSDDKIIPTKNQEAFWQTKANINGGHAIFGEFRNWNELL